LCRKNSLKDESFALLEAQNVSSAVFVPS
jgi:hypothetical protein